MKAMILAAGLGARMRPLTDLTPKPLLEVGGVPLIVWHISHLVKSGIRDIVINISHLGNQIPQRLGDGSEWGANIVYSDEQKEGALESAGGIIKALPLLGEETFLVVNGDIWCAYDFDAAKELGDGILEHLILVPNPEHNPKGDFAIENGFLKDEGEEKYTFSGIGYYNPKLFEGIPYGKRALAPVLKDAMKKGKVTGELFKGEWRDIGTPQRLKELNSYLLQQAPS